MKKKVKPKIHLSVPGYSDKALPDIDDAGKLPRDIAETTVDIIALGSETRIEPSLFETLLRMNMPKIEHIRHHLMTKKWSY